MYLADFFSTYTSAYHCLFKEDEADKKLKFTKKNKSWALNQSLQAKYNITIIDKAMQSSKVYEKMSDEDLY